MDGENRKSRNIKEIQSFYRLQRKDRQTIGIV